MAFKCLLVYLQKNRAFKWPFVAISNVQLRWILCYNIENAQDWKIYKSAFECHIISIISLQFVIWMPYFIGDKLNCYWGGLLLINWRIPCGGYSPILVPGFQQKTRKPFYPLKYCLCIFFHIYPILNFLIYCCIVLIRLFLFSKK